MAALVHVEQNMNEKPVFVVSRRRFAGGLVAAVVVSSCVTTTAAAARQAPDLVITSLTWSVDNVTFNNATIKESSNVRFRAVVANQGKVSIPPGVVIEVGFFIDGELTVWSDTFNQGLAAGRSVTLTANELWFDVSAGRYSVQARADYQNRIPGESNEGNNSRTAGLIISPMAADVTVDKPWDHGRLQASANGRYLQHEDGTPFLWFGDTNWGGIHRFKSDDDRRRYFADRAGKGISVIQTIITGIDNLVMGPAATNGSKNLYNPGVALWPTQDPAQSNEVYMQQVDSYVALAAEYGLYVALWPAWGSYVCPGTGDGSHITPYLLNPAKANAYGTFLGNRYKDVPNVIWVVGGDRAPDCSSGSLTAWRTIANAIKAVDSNHVMTFHPHHLSHTYTLLHNDPWLDMNSEQSWSNINTIIADMSGAYNQSPPKPAIMIEAAYELGVNWSNWTAVERRLQPYYTMLAGGAGYTYGNRYLWPVSYGESGENGQFWYNHLDGPNIVETALWARLWQSFDWWKLVPQQSAISGDAGTGTSQTRAAVANDGTFLVVYYPTNTARTIVKSKITASANANATWIRPTTLAESVVGMVSTAGTQSFKPPAGWADAVLILEAI